MESINGIALEVGQEVYILQTPIIGEHRFVLGVITGIHKTKVSVEGLFTERYLRGFIRKVVTRYPNQIIVK